MRRLSAAEVRALKVCELGLNPDAVDLSTVEGLAGALRRAASYLCPCSPATLVRAVVQPLRGLVPDLEAAEELVEATLEAMVAHGDVVEQPEMIEGAASGRTLFYAAPASFVMRQSGVAILLGVTTDQLSPLPSDLGRRIQHLAHVRRLIPTSGEDLRTELGHFGLIELTSDGWLRRPPATTAEQLLAMADRNLDRVAPSRDVPGLVLLDPTRSVHYYRGRWSDPKARTGRYVARRKQAYGADLWCYVQVKEGHPERLVDLPCVGSRWRGCDEAWHLQMAIDAQRGSPQCFRVTKEGDSYVFEVFSPVPAWARRRWDAVGELVRSVGCLFAYRFGGAEIDEERQFAREALWLSEAGPRTGRGMA